MNALIKNILRWLLPQSLYATLLAVRSRRFIQAFERAHNLDSLNALFEKLHGTKVRSGPFKGLSYTPMTTQRHVTQRLLGLYESELHGIIEEVIGFKPQMIFDIGCAEGYYAGGLAMRLPESSIVAFDTDPWARRATRKLLKANGLKNVDVRGYCTPELLASFVNPGSFVLSDCEGFEYALFKEPYMAAYREVTLLIELHDAPPSMKHPLVQRFQSTHRIIYIPSVARRADGVSELNSFDDDARRLMISDLRKPWQGWIYLCPLKSPQL
jgi:hypothetical protein